MSSSRLQITQGLQLVLQGITDPSTNQPLYGLVKRGHLFDPTQFTATPAAVDGGWAEITFALGKSGPAGSGGNLIGWRIEDAFALMITSGWDYEADSTAAHDSMTAAMDILLPILHSHVVIPSPGNPTQPLASVYSLLEEEPEHAGPVRFPNGHIYLLWHVVCLVKQQYNVTLTVP